MDVRLNDTVLIVKTGEKIPKITEILYEKCHPDVYAPCGYSKRQKLQKVIYYCKSLKVRYALPFHTKLVKAL